MTTGVATNAVQSPRPTLAYVESDHKPGFIVRIIILIIEIIKKIFGIFYFWKADPQELETRQIQAYNSIKFGSYLRPPGPAPKNDYQSFQGLFLNLQPQDVNAEDNREELVPIIPIKSEYAGKDFPQALQNMRRMMGACVSSAVDCIHEAKIVPLTEHRMQYVEKASKVIKDLSAILIQIGFQLKVPIFDMLQQNQISFTNNELFDESSKKALNWLIENPENPSLLSEVSTDLSDNLKALVQQGKLNLEFNEVTLRCQKSVVDWVFDQRRSPQFHDTYLREQHPSTIVEPIYQQCLTVLIEKKVDGLCNDLNLRLIENLPNLIHDFLKTNCLIITEELSGRIADILSHVEISELINNLTDAVHKQTKTYIKAKKKVDKQSGAKFSDRDHRPEVEGEYIRACAQKFATLSDAHPKLNSIVTIPRGRDHLTWPGSDNFKKWKESIEERFITEACQTLIDVLFPKKKWEEDGKIIEIDGLKNLWKRVVVPEEMKGVLAEVESFIQRFLPQDFTFARDAKTMINNMIEQCIIMTAKTQLCDFLSKKLFTLFKSLITPEMFSNLLRRYIAPVIEEQCINLATRIILGNGLESFTDDFALIRKTKTTFLHTSNTIKKFITLKLQTYARNEELPENDQDHIDRLSSLIYHDLNKALFASDIEEATLESISEALTTSSLGSSDLHHEIAKTAVQPYLGEIAEPLKITSETALLITKIQNSLAQKLYEIFDAKANEFKRVGGSITKEDFLKKIAHPLIEEFGDVLTHKDFESDLPAVAIGKYLEGEKGGEEKTNIYSEIVLNLLFEIGDFCSGDFLETIKKSVVTSFETKINQSISKTLSRFKKDDYLAVGMITQKLYEKYSTKEALERVFFSEEADTAPDLNLTITRLSGIVYDIFHHIAVPSEGVAGMFQNLGVTAFIGSDSSKINNTIRKIYNRLFQDELLNANLVFIIKDILAKHITNASLAIGQETASYTGIQNNLDGSDIEIMPFSPGRPVSRHKIKKVVVR